MVRSERNSEDETEVFVTSCASPEASEATQHNASAAVEMPSMIMTDIVKPFSFVSGNANKKGRLPFKKHRSGLQGVIYKQATKGRMVFKNGVFNTVSDMGDGKSYKLFKVE